MSFEDFKRNLPSIEKALAAKHEAEQQAIGYAADVIPTTAREFELLYRGEQDEL